VEETPWEAYYRLNKINMALLCDKNDEELTDNASEDANAAEESVGSFVDAAG